MNFFTSAAALLCALMVHARAQPPACKDESHCSSGYFCQTDVHFCRKCLSCEDLKRLPPEQPTSCIQSVSTCGPCLDGLVEDLHGDVTAQCVVATTRYPDSLPVYVWVAIVAGLMFFVIVVAIVVYALRNKELFKNVVSGETSVRSSCVSGPARAPEPPPPYNDQYVPVRPSSPPAPPSPHPAPAPPQPDHDESWPFIKPAPRAAGREAAGAQAAQVYNNPAYVRGPRLHPDPPSYDESVEEPEPMAPFTVHDEDTMESTWTPHQENNAHDTASAATVVEEPVTTVARTEPGPPAKRARLPQDSNNNPPPPAGADSLAPSAASLTINVLVHQRNDLRL